MKKDERLPRAEKRKEWKQARYFLMLAHSVTETNYSLKTDKCMATIPIWYVSLYHYFDSLHGM